MGGEDHSVLRRTQGQDEVKAAAAPSVANVSHLLNRLDPNLFSRCGLLMALTFVIQQ